jgi:hypothetical protein
MQACTRSVSTVSGGRTSYSSVLFSGVYSASNRNEYHRNRKCFWGVKRGRCVRLITSPPSVSGTSAQYGIINI